jgi:hypothetical protein
MVSITDRLNAIGARLEESYTHWYSAWRARNKALMAEIEAIQFAQRRLLAEEVAKAGRDGDVELREAALNLLIRHIGGLRELKQFQLLADELAALELYSKAELMERVKQGPVGRLLRGATPAYPPPSDPPPPEAPASTALP